MSWNQNDPLEGLKNVPTRWKCAIGGEWKPTGGFSERALNGVLWKLQMNQKVDPANSGMKCMEHTTANRNEIHCQGPCNRIKPIGEFSKSTRRNGVDVCKSCTVWRESMRPGQVPWAAAGTHITNDEPVMLRNLNQFTADEFLPFDDAASVAPRNLAYDQGRSGASASVPSSQAPDDGSVVAAITSGNHDSISQLIRKTIPPTAPIQEPREHDNRVPQSTATSVASGVPLALFPPPRSTRPNASQYLPPHLRGATRTNSVAGSTTQEPLSPLSSGRSQAQQSAVSSSDARSISTATTMRAPSESHHRPPVSFNAYDVNGALHRLNLGSDRSSVVSQTFGTGPTTTGTMTSTAPSRLEKVEKPIGRGPWAKAARIIPQPDMSVAGFHYPDHDVLDAKPGEYSSEDEL